VFSNKQLGEAKMLKTIQQNTAHNRAKESSRQELKPKTVLIEAQQYLDFKFGKMAIDIRLPDGATATLIIGNQGQAFFQLVGEA
jgi:hypothetical protein